MEQSSSSDFILPADSTQLSTAYTDLTVVSSQGYSCLVKATRSGRWWMLKGLKPDFRNQLIYQELLQKEYKMMAPLQHLNIVNTMNREQVDGLGWCIVMEWIDGVNLKQWLAENHPQKDLQELLIFATSNEKEYVNSLVDLDLISWDESLSKPISA